MKSNSILKIIFTEYLPLLVVFGLLSLIPLQGSLGTVHLPGVLYLLVGLLQVGVCFTLIYRLSRLPWWGTAFLALLAGLLDQWLMLATILRIDGNLSVTPAVYILQGLADFLVPYLLMDWILRRFYGKDTDRSLKPVLGYFLLIYIIAQILLIVVLGLGKFQDAWVEKSGWILAAAQVAAWWLIFGGANWLVNTWETVTRPKPQPRPDPKPQVNRLVQIRESVDDMGITTTTYWASSKDVAVRFLTDMNEPEGFDQVYVNTEDHTYWKDGGKIVEGFRIK